MGHLGTSLQDSNVMKSKLRSFSVKLLQCSFGSSTCYYRSRSRDGNLWGRGIKYLVHNILEVVAILVFVRRGWINPTVNMAVAGKLAQIQ